MENIQSLNEAVKVQWDLALQTYIENIKKDYLTWNHSQGERDQIGQEVSDKMTYEFFNSLSYKIGTAYIAVWKGNSIHSFIVRADGPKFKAGDILKAATWRAPAKNKARGNIFGTYHIQWTGAEYLR